MRDIKYKGWNTEQNIMYSEKELGQDELTIDPDGRGFVNVCSSDKKFSEYYSHILPLQYTGQKDNNGVEIYENDIVQFTAFGRTVIGVIEWDVDDGLPGFIIVDTDGSGTIWSFLYDDLTVIGNIYKNPELLI